MLELLRYYINCMFSNWIVAFDVFEFRIKDFWNSILARVGLLMTLRSVLKVSTWNQLKIKCIPSSRTPKLMSDDSSALSRWDSKQYHNITKLETYRYKPVFLIDNQCSNSTNKVSVKISVSFLASIEVVWTIQYSQYSMDEFSPNQGSTNWTPEIKRCSTPVMYKMLRWNSAMSRFRKRDLLFWIKNFELIL